jgi:uncharacterized protein affecting Mg2+/Co2+ transport
MIETETLRVISRHWKIFADDELVLEVPLGSPGVIGMKPELPPGATFMYYSGTDVNAGRKGFMTGSLGVVVVGSKSPRARRSRCGAEDGIHVADGIGVPTI